MKTINLDEILKSKLIPAVYANTPDITYNATIEAMKESCKQTLELAAENAEADIVDDSDFSNGKIVIDKQSILNTINQIK